MIDVEMTFTLNKFNFDICLMMTLRDVLTHEITGNASYGRDPGGSVGDGGGGVARLRCRGRVPASLGSSGCSTRGGGCSSSFAK